MVLVLFRPSLFRVHPTLWAFHFANKYDDFSQIWADFLAEHEGEDGFGRVEIGGQQTLGRRYTGVVVVIGVAQCGNVQCEFPEAGQFRNSLHDLECLFSVS